MSKKPVRGLSPDMLQSVPARDTPDILAPPDPAPPLGVDAALSTQPPAERGPSTQTVKVPDADFIRLKTLSAYTRRRHQDIILSALREYLDRHGA